MNKNSSFLKYVSYGNQIHCIVHFQELEYEIKIFQEDQENQKVNIFFIVLEIKVIMGIIEKNLRAKTHLVTIYCP